MEVSQAPALDRPAHAPTAHGDNHFNVLRLAAAVAVLLSHGEFLYRLTMKVQLPGHTLGSLAVYCFFFISGYLVCQSWHREPRWGAFWVKRIMRIFPGLIVATIFSVAVIGWAMTTLGTAAYWSHRDTWLNLANNMAGIATVQTLPGVFESNPFARAVNGSLWTIRYELLMYLLLSTAGVAGWTRHRWVYPLGAGAMAAMWLWAHQTGHAATPWLFSMFTIADMTGFGVVFLLGSTFAAYQARRSGWWAALALGGAILAWCCPTIRGVQVGVWICIAAGVFWAAHAGVRRWGGAWPREDLSYGVYIYAFPIQQAMTEIALRRGWSLLTCLALSLAVTLGAAAVSWFFVEKPFISHGRRLLQHLRARRPGTSVRPAA